MQPNDQMPPQIPPDPKIPPVQPGRRTVMQPLSSEDDIRRAAASAAPSNQSSESDGHSLNVDSSDATQAAPEVRESAYEGGLVTEPIRHADQTPLQSGMTQPSYPIVAPQVKKPIVKIIVVILSLLAVGLVALMVWLHFFNRVAANNIVQESSNILNRESSADSAQEGSTQSTHDLLQEEFGDSTYLRPKEWINLSASASTSTSGYANAEETGNGEMTAIIALSDFSGELAMNATTDAERTGLRKYFMDTMPDYILGSAMLVNAPIGCDSGTFAVTRSENTTKMKTTIGIADVVATCSKSGTPITMKSHIVTGVNDGQARMIVVAATDEEWLKNETTFQQMLDSVEEYKAS